MPPTVTLTKDRARKPLVEGANAIGSQTCDCEGNPIYRLTLYQAPAIAAHGYEVTLDRTTMLEVVSSWLAGEARDARAAGKKERQK